ncbi:MAG: hypothetical protein QOF10_5119 [Kribbellaceae bacterium]|jgi:hypothetical protein|nr:hypothetical protein [Kribbellaceae bacterium]
MSESDAPDRPSPAAGVLGKTEILSYIGEVADELGVRGLTGSLVVVGGSYMAGRTADHDDMVALWPSCRFVDAQSAVDAYYVAYPFEEHDPYLVDYVQQIADLAAATE